MTTEYYVLRPTQIVEKIVTSELQFRTIKAGEALTQYALVYQDGELIKKADATSPATMDALGLLSRPVAAEVVGDVIIRGRVTNSAWSWTSGAYLFASTSGGHMAEAPPTASGNVTQQVARALKPTLIEVNPQRGYQIAYEV